jgi:uracil-DNA glycosylase
VDKLLEKISQCTVCAQYLSSGPRPVVQLSPQAQILIAAQAPGRKVHETGIPFNDASGNRLREWLGIDRQIFYDQEKVAILPMGFCYPGKGRTGDLPPRPECKDIWHASVLGYLKNIRLRLIVGRYALDYYLPQLQSSTLTETVRSWRSFYPGMVPLPHPSPRNTLWLKRNPWFEKDVLPALQQRVGEVLATSQA